MNHRSLFVSPLSAIDIASIPTPALTALYQLLFDFAKKKNSHAHVPFLSLSLSCLSEGLHVFHHVLELLCDAVLLLGDSVCELVWDDCSLVGMELASKNTT